MKHLAIFLFCIFLPVTALLAQNDTTVSEDTVDTVSTQTTTQEIRFQHHRVSPASIMITRDSIALMEYHHGGEVLTKISGIYEYGLGNYGQPLWLSRLASGPQHWRLSLNGDEMAGALTAVPDILQVPIEDIDVVTISAQYDAFWLGGPGALLSADISEKDWYAPRPVTRLRHTEAANEYLYTDGMFTLNLSDDENLFLAGTRTVIGSSSLYDAARFINNRHEGWNLRIRYRNRLTEHVTVASNLRYDDGITLLNGGVAPPFDPGLNPLPYEPEGSISLSEYFDSKAVVLVNPTMYTQLQRYTAEAFGRIQWDEDSTHITEIRVSGQAETRRFQDNLQSITTDSLAEGILNLTDTWSRSKIELRQWNDLGWSALSAAASASPYSVQKGGDMFSNSGINTMLRAKLELTLGSVHLSGMARLDNIYGRSAMSVGTGADIEFSDKLTLWGGASYSPRIYNLTEQWYREEAASSFMTDLPLEEVRVAELGLRFRQPWLWGDLRVFQRRNEHRLTLMTSPVSGTIPGRYSLAAIVSDESENVSGFSADVRMSFWDMHLDQQLNMLLTDRDQSSTPSLTAPLNNYKAELYYRGALIEETLNLRAGVSFEYNGNFLPLVYHPLTGLFTHSAPDNTWTYTDMWRVDIFLFATIKDRATLHVILHNVFDTAYITAQFYPMYDRALRFGVDWYFFD